MTGPMWVIGAVLHAYCGAVVTGLLVAFGWPLSERPSLRVLEVAAMVALYPVVLVVVGVIVAIGRLSNEGEEP